MGEAQENCATVLFWVAVVEKVSESVFKLCIGAIRGVVHIGVALTGIHTHSVEVFGVAKEAVSDSRNFGRGNFHTSRSQHLVFVAQADIAHFLSTGVHIPSLELIVRGGQNVVGVHQFGRKLHRCTDAFIVGDGKSATVRFVFTTLESDVHYCAIVAVSVSGRD